MKKRMETIRKKLAFRKNMLDKLYAAYEALVSGGVKAYMIDDRQLTLLDLDKLSEEIRKLEEEIDELEALLDGGGRRKAVGVIPRDW